MRRNRRTIGEPLELSGVGLHTGKPARLRIRPLPEGGGLRFRFGDDCYSIAEARLCDSRRKTGIIFPGGQTLYTVEHLLSALMGVGVDDSELSVEGGELPALDGSALPYATALLAAGLIERDEPLVGRSLVAPIALDMGVQSIIALPSEEFRITYVIDYPASPIGTQVMDFTLTQESFISDIAPCRTFCTEQEVAGLREMGLALGASLDNALVIGGEGPLGEDGLRSEKECVAHKILDLIGDLALLGFAVTAHYVCIRGGHDLHARLVDRLRGVFPEKP